MQGSSVGGRWSGENDTEDLSLLAYQEIVAYYLRRLPGTSKLVYLALPATLSRNQSLTKSGHEIGWRTGSEDGKGR
jgi:hypothetical protein